MLQHLCRSQDECSEETRAALHRATIRPPIERDSSGCTTSDAAGVPRWALTPYVADEEDFVVRSVAQDLDALWSSVSDAHDLDAAEARVTPNPMLRPMRGMVARSVPRPDDSSVSAKRDHWKAHLRALSARASGVPPIPETRDTARRARWPICPRPPLQRPRPTHPAT